MERHSILDGRVHIYRRSSTRYWHCSTSLGLVEHRASSQQPLLEDAKAWAEEWYFGLRGKQSQGVLGKGKRFREVAEVFEREFKALTRGERNEHYVNSLLGCLRIHTLPFFGDKLVSEVTPGLVQQYRIHRLENPRPHPMQRPGTPVKAPTRKTLREEMIPIRQVLKTAVRHGWLPAVPDLSEPYRGSSKVRHRGWFSHSEYKQLYTATRARADCAMSGTNKWRCEQLHDFVLFLANTGLRPDEAWSLEFRDVHIVRDEATREVILEIEVRGKRGVGYCKSMPGAVLPFRRLLRRPRPRPAEEDPRMEPREAPPRPMDRIFPDRHKKLFNAVLDAAGLKVDRDGNRRTAYSLRHTYICFRLLEGAKIYEVAKNCRTSVEMIEKHYAVHLKNMIDTASVNVRRGRPVPLRTQAAPRQPRSTRTRPRVTTPSRRDRRQDV